MAKKTITIDDLARMIKKGFDETPTRMEMNKRFDALESKFDRIERVVMQDHRQRIERLEFEVKNLKNLLAV